jgi:hypothetical protein
MGVVAVAMGGCVLAVAPETCCLWAQDAVGRIRSWGAHAVEQSLVLNARLCGSRLAARGEAGDGRGCIRGCRSECGGEGKVGECLGTRRRSLTLAESHHRWASRAAGWREGELRCGIVPSPAHIKTTGSRKLPASHAWAGRSHAGQQCLPDRGGGALPGPKPHAAARRRVQPCR